MKKLYFILFAAAIACSRKTVLKTDPVLEERAGFTVTDVDTPFLKGSVQYAFYSNKQKTMVFTNPLIDLSIHGKGATITGTRNITCLDVNYAVLGTYPATFTSPGKFVLPKECQKDWNGSLADGLNGKLYSYFKIQGLIPLFTAVTNVKREFTYSNNPGFKGLSQTFNNSSTSIDVKLVKQMPNSQIDNTDDYTVHFEVFYKQSGIDNILSLNQNSFLVTGAQLAGQDTTIVTIPLPDLLIYESPVVLNFRGYLLKKLDASSTQNKTIAIDTFSISLADPSSACLISNWQDLKNMGTNYPNITDTCYLQNDIDLAAAGNWTPIQGFKGVFDGQNYTLSHLSYNSNTINGVGLFGTLTGTLANKILIKNLKMNNTSITTNKNRVGALGGFFTYVTLENITISSSTINGNSDVGGVVGRLSNGTMNKVQHGAGSIAAAGNNAGGLVGYALTNTVISKSHALQNITISNSNSGGLVGSLESGSSVTNSYASGNVTSDDDFVGGLVGAASESTITNTYAKGNVVSTVGGVFLGGLVGDAISCTITNSYFPQGENHPENDFGTALTPAQILGQASFVGFDFGTIWNWIGGGAFPTLQ